jgi:acyl-CoA thioester hydrolase
MNNTQLIDIRFSDMDSQGHVHHEAIVGWIAHARVTFINNIIGGAGIENIDYTLVHLQVDFEKSITHPGEVKIDVFVKKMGNKSLTIWYTLFKDRVRFAQAESVTVFFDTTTEDTIYIPSILRKALTFETIKLKYWGQPLT